MPCEPLGTDPQVALPRRARAPLFVKVEKAVIDMELGAIAYRVNGHRLPIESTIVYGNPIARLDDAGLAPIRPGAMLPALEVGGSMCGRSEELYRLQLIVIGAIAVGAALLILAIYNLL